MPPAAPFLPTAEEMGERTPPKTNGFWISFRCLPVRADSAEMLNRHPPLRAAAFALKCESALFYRFLRLSNRLKTVEPGTPTFCTASGSGDRRRPMPHFGQLLPCSARVGYLPHSTPHGARADFQTAGLNGVFAHFCRRGQKWVAPERETLLTAVLRSLPFGKESGPSETPPYPQAQKNHRAAGGKSSTPT